MKTWDVIVVGGGIIGLSLALSLRKNGLSCLIVERGEPGREASHAAGGMLTHCDPCNPPPLGELCSASFRLYPEFVHELEDESGDRVDLRLEGSIVLDPEGPSSCPGATSVDAGRLAQLEPGLAASAACTEYRPEGSVDPRTLVSAAAKAAKHREIEISSGSRVSELLVSGGRAVGVKTVKTHFSAAAVVNCAGAWAGSISGPLPPFPTRPRKGQMLAVVGSRRDLLRHVVRSPEIYVIPRSDGRILIGATVEDVGFDKRTNPDTIQRLQQAAANLIPELGQSRMLEAWAGLRPGTPDDLPILGATSVPGYFVATGHFRDGILLAPITATVMAQLIQGHKPEFDLAPFSPARFES